MRKYIYDDHPRVREWVSARIPGAGFADWDTAIGVEQDGELIGGVIYTHWSGTDLRMHVAGEGPWVTREALFRFYAYPFLQLNCRRVTGLVRTDNLKAQKFDESLGFVKEGVLRDADDDGCDLIVYGMLKDECRWIKNKNKRIPNGEEV